MKQAIRYLAIAALVQLALIPLVYWSELGGSAEAAAQPLLGLAADQITDIVIGGDNKSSAHLHKTGAVWQLPDYQQLPADAAKVTAMLRTLAATEPRWPVSTSADAVRRFEVADDHYQRKLQFGTASGKTQTLYLGSAPAFRKVHARRGGDRAVYAIDFNTFDTPADPAQWLDKSLLALHGKITAISSGDLKLQLNAQSWQLAGDADTKLAQVPVDTLVKQLQNLSVQALADAQIPAKLPLARTLDVVADGTTYTLQFKRDKDAIYLHSSTRPQWFKVADYAVQAILDLKRETLLPAAPAAAAATAKSAH
jgi:hypothetical protein